MGARLTAPVLPRRRRQPAVAFHGGQRAESGLVLYLQRRRPARRYVSSLVLHAESRSLPMSLRWCWWDLAETAGSRARSRCGDVLTE